jgi:uncharacterized protein YcnI
MKLRKLAVVVPVILVGLLGGVLPASAKVEFEPNIVKPNTHVGLGVIVTKDCEKSLTTELQIKLPSNLNVKEIMLVGVFQNNRIPKGWGLNLIEKSRLLVAKGPSIKTSSSNPLKINFMLTIPNKKNGTVINFPTVQSCGSSKVAWTVPMTPSKAGKSSTNLNSPYLIVGKK